MPTMLEQLAAAIVPERTILFFGSGSSIPSGAPSVQQLIERMTRHYNIASADLNLAELSSLIEITTKDRRALIEHVRASFTNKRPTQGLLTVPDFSWKSIYTTNYDTLVEQAYVVAPAKSPIVQPSVVA